MKIIKLLYSHKVILVIMLAIFLGCVYFGYDVITNRKNIEFFLDGKKIIVTTRQVFAGGLIDKLMEEEEYKVLSDTKDYYLVDDEMVLSINTKKEIKVIMGKEEQTVETYATTIYELLDELNIDTETKINKYILKGSHITDLIVDTEVVNLVHQKIVNEVESVKSKIGVSYKYSSSLAVGKEKVLSEGTPKIVDKTYSVLYMNDSVVSKELISEEVVSKGTNKVIEKGTKGLKVSGNVWDRLAKCESGGRWNINTGNGYYGGLQFNKQTWLSNAAKVGVTVSRADLATKEEQILVASYLQSRRGWSPWGGCARKLGLL